MADITLKDSRGRYFAYRNMMCNLAALGGSLIAGWLVKGYDFPLGYQVSFFVALGLGLAASYTYSNMPVPPLPKRSISREQPARLKDWWYAISKYTAFRNYCLTSMLWNFGVSFAGPLFSVYYRQDLGGDPGFWGVVTASGLIASLVSQRFWGPMADRYGQKNVMLLGGIGAASLPFLWWLVPRYELAVVAQFIGSFCWGGYNLAAFNLILEITPDEGRTTFVGIYNTMSGLASSIAPLIGGHLADIYGLRPVIIMSGILRWSGYFAFRRCVPSGTDTQLPLRKLLPFDQAIGTKRIADDLSKKDTDMSR
ncbi:MAG: MFS transporter [Firmicutes bacterium]|nr:MFS transporter [Bacillota bacterium]